MKKSICVYCGSNPGAAPEYAQAAQAVGVKLAQNDIRLVYGGGQVGLMGLVADACIDAGGQVYGVIPDFLHQKEIAHPRVQDMHIVPSMHERKLKMADASDAFIAMPGGIGTMEELFEVWTWSQLGRHEKPVGVLNVNGYYDKLLEFIDHMTGEGFLLDKHRAMLMRGESIEELLEQFEAFEHPGMIATLAAGQV
ncbi:LOG family protein [Oceanicaulis alexandrii]|uniref:LOG family protein n=1 Tax=Oceanicaulis alexandrii TaxID=153233 RepID=UPI0003B4E8E2|nr:TIGR00730 family Rossman fold protein [Oceanicaulis alexandrii]MBL4538234.1 TIGR00730 family Rossman fold protein [Oceanicaulis sp.]VXC78995.1 putative cytokinin riboside 5'-monophosphate phosphoribohydrolase [Oceanicaulis sp. 350]